MAPDRQLTSMRTEAPRTGGAGKLVRWRRARLVGAGFPLPLATRLARDSRYDLHALKELTDNGCRPELAVRIVAPLDLGDAA